MKKWIVITALTLVVLAHTRIQANTNPVTVVSSTDAFVYVKVSKEMFGGVLQVTDEKDSVIEEIRLDHKKIYVDFFDRHAGNYFIKIKKDDIDMTFGYALIESGQPVDERKNIPARKG